MSDSPQKTREKVLYVITKSNFGGAQRYVYDLATNLPLDRFEPVVAFGYSGSSAQTGKLAQMLAEKSIRTITIPELTRDIGASDFSAIRALVRLFKDERPDVVHLNSSKAGGLGSLAAHIAGVPNIIFTAHGWPFWEDRNPLAIFAIRILSWLTVLFSHTTICISEFDRQNISWMPFVKDKIVLIYNGLPHISFLERQAGRDALFPVDTQAQYSNDSWVITNGELTHNKNLFVGIDAIALHNRESDRKIFYSIMGDGELRMQIESYIREHNLSDSVRLLGFVPDARTYLKAFDVFFMPSKKEGVPYAILEAGAACLPVVASSVGGIPEIIEDGRSGILRPNNDVGGFAQALGGLVDDMDKSAQMGAELKEIVANKFSIEAMLQKTLALY